MPAERWMNGPSLTMKKPEPIAKIRAMDFMKSVGNDMYLYILMPAITYLVSGIPLPSMCSKLVVIATAIRPQVRD